MARTRPVWVLGYRPNQVQLGKMGNRREEKGKKTEKAYMQN